jgi:hypothetical protein
MLEFYPCGEFHRIECTRRNGVWCDGLIQLSVEKPARCSFRVVALAYLPASVIGTT